MVRDEQLETLQSIQFMPQEPKYFLPQFMMQSGALKNSACPTVIALQQVVSQHISHQHHQQVSTSTAESLELDQKVRALKLCL